LQGMTEVGVPDLVIRESRLEADLAILAAQIGRETMPAVAEVTDPHAGWLDLIYDAGFGSWANEAV